MDDSNEQIYYGEPFPLKTRRSKYVEWVRKGLLVFRAGIDMYSAVKRRDSLSIGLSIVSSMEAVQGLVEKKYLDLEELCYDLKLERTCIGVEETVYHTLDKLGIKKTTEILGKAEDGDHTFKIFHLEKTKIYFYDWEGNSIGNAFALNSDIAMEEIAKEFQKKLGNNIGVKTVSSNINNCKYIYLNEIKNSLATYIESGKEQKYYEDIIKFKKKGINRSSLVYGPPGTGKTLFSIKINDLLGGRLLVLQSSIITSAAKGEENLSKIIELVKPTIILFDDMDRIENLDQLLNDVEQLNMIENKHLVIMATVNDLASVPKAMRRPGRFDEIIHIDFPDGEKREAVCKNYMFVYGCRICNENFNNIVTLTDGMSCADLKEIMLQASIQNYEKIPKLIEHMKEMSEI